MKRLMVLLSLLLASAVALTAVGTIVAAQDELVTMDEAHVERIRANCGSAKTTLARIHASDALLRVNRGQLYESVSTKLMANLNSRIALNRLEGAELIQIASDYERQLQKFRIDYQAYEQQFSQLLRIDCDKQPVQFYDTVASVRDKRAAVRDDVSGLNDEMKVYLEAFTRFETQYVLAAKEVTR